MYRLIKFLLVILASFPISVFSQHYVNVPYSRFGVGDLINTGLDYNRSLGGSSIALRPKNQINYLNPASYTSQDTLSFLFQGGLTGRYSLITTSIDNDKTQNSNLEYLVMGFPITNFWKASVGLVPYSREHYFFTQTQTVGASDEITSTYLGEGGLNDFYFGSSFEVGKFLSVGLNASYLFGSLDRDRSVNLTDSINYSSTVISERIIASDFYYRIGLQAYHTFNKKHQFILGLTYDSPTKIKIQNTFFAARFFPQGSGIYVDTLKSVNDSLGFLELPNKMGIGLTYIYNDIFMITGEYSTQNFTEAKLNGGNTNLANYSSFRCGMELVPVPLSNPNRASYFQRMHYRAGGHYTNTYINVNNTPITDYGISLGLGFPWRNSKKQYTYTMFNVSYEYGIRGTFDNGLIKENYHIITLGFALHDYWFMKAKYD